MSTEREELSPVVTLDLRAINAVITEDEGDLIMLVDDGDVQVEFGSGLCGSWDQAITGAHRVAATAMEFAEALQAHRTLNA
jgi:hypothetical protein